MSYDAERQSIESRLKSAWTATPIKYENVAYTPGNTTTAFIELMIINSESVQVSLGSPALYRHPGTISINVRTRLQIGSSMAKQYADTLAGIFRGKQFDGITCRSPRVLRLGEVNGWFMYNVGIPFFRDELFNSEVAVPSPSNSPSRTPSLTPSRTPSATPEP